MSRENIAVLTPESFASQVLDAERPVLVDFAADWCAPCRAMAPYIDELGRDFAGRADVLTVDVDAHPELAERYRVRSIPSLLLFQDGQEVERIVGRAAKADLAAKLEDLIRSHRHGNRKGDLQ